MKHKPFAGELRKPIRRKLFDETLISGFDADEQNAAETRRVSALQVEKTLLLFDHYGAERGDWMRLAICLARQFVPGLQTIGEDEGKKPKRWTPAATMALVADIEAIKQERPRNDREACRVYLKRAERPADERAVRSLITRLSEARQPKNNPFLAWINDMPGDEDKRLERLISLGRILSGKK